MSSRDVAYDFSIFNPEKYKGNIIHYTSDADNLIIDVYVKRISGIYVIDENCDFQSLKPEFDSGFIEHITKYLEEEKELKSKSLRIMFHLPCAYLMDERYQNIDTDFQSALAQLLPIKMQDVKKVRRKNKKYFAFGFVLLVLCYLIAEILLNNCYQVGLIVGISEGIAVFGWIMLWRPLAFLMYEKGEVLRSFEWMEKIRDSPVEKTKWNGGTPDK